MKNLHIICGDLFTGSVVEFFNDNFNNDDNLIIAVGEMAHNKSICKYVNVKTLPKKFSTCVKIAIQMRKAHFIYLHALPACYAALQLFFHPWILKKCCWYIWGGDLYMHKNRNDNMRHRIYELIRKSVIKNMGSIVAATRGDYELARQWYGAKGRCYQAFYATPIKLTYLDSIKSIDKENTEIINIQIGNSASPTNNHMQIIDLIKKYARRQIRVYVPLSYGPVEYANEVAKYGKEALGDKFIPMFEFLQAEEYAQFLASIDIVVFAHDQQKALGHTFALAYLGKKIYLRIDISSWGLLKDDLDLDVYNVLDIESESFESFISGLNNQNNSAKAKKTLDLEYIAEQWRHIFEENEAAR